MTARPGRGTVVPGRGENLRADHEALLQVVIAAERSGSSVPCRDGSLTVTAAWTATDTKTQAAAARECSRCPVLAECHTYARLHSQELGVLGGTTEADRRREAS
ncbi:WhiB family transcriptional regulator [Isoptericola sp. NPDC056578]|uniref:WhiB family transcriptional regulator n=1 Tax=Isoptericola sp. NPDC056578 TaxID=3345870 RepID=UPI00367B6D81